MMTNHSQSSEEPNLDSLLPSSDLSTAVASSTGKGQEGPSPPGLIILKFLNMYIEFFLRMEERENLKSNTVCYVSQNK